MDSRQPDGQDLHAEKLPWAIQTSVHQIPVFKALLPGLIKPEVKQSQKQKCFNHPFHF